MDSINILVLNLIIVIYTFLTNLFCCFTPELAKIKMSPETVIVHRKRHHTRQYVEDIFVAAGSSAVNKKRKKNPIIVHEKAHVCLSIVLLFLYSCCIIVTLCCYSDLCNITFPIMKNQYCCLLFI